MDTPITRRMTAMYVFALALIAILLITEQALIQQQLSVQAHDTHVVNIAGRQRMLSQKLCKAALAIRFSVDDGTRQMRIAELQKVAELWERSQRGLQNGDPTLDLPGKNSDRVRSMFSDIEPAHQLMLDNAHSLVAAAQDRNAPDPGWSPYIQRILAEENTFLTGMDAIVTQFDIEAKQHSAQLKTTEFALLGVSLVVIVLLGVCVFRPAVAGVRNTLLELIEAEERIMEQNAALEKRNHELEEQRVQISFQQVRNKEMEAKLAQAQSQLTEATTRLSRAVR